PTKRPRSDAACQRTRDSGNTQKRDDEITGKQLTNKQNIVVHDCLMTLFVWNRTSNKQCISNNKQKTNKCHFYPSNYRVAYTMGRCVNHRGRQTVQRSAVCTDYKLNGWGEADDFHSIAGASRYRCHSSDDL